MKCAITLLTGLLAASVLSAQKPDQVRWSLALEPARGAPGSKVLAHLTGNIDPGWHVYSMTTGGAIPTRITLKPNPAIARARIYQPTPRRAFDKNFGLETETFENSVAFLIELELRPDAQPGNTEVAAEVRYQTCNDRLCIPPVRRTAAANLDIDKAAQQAAAAVPPGYVEYTGGPAKSSAGSPASGPEQTQQESLAGFLLVAFGFGLAAIFTPCVFPMIPITMSYFLNRPSGSRQESLLHSVLFCVGIVVLFSSLGLIATAILGPFGVVQLGSNPWVNGFIGLIFLIFGLSLLGAFEITIPSSVLTKLDSASRRGGVIGTLLMGLTFSLASFACVGPFVGTLLGASVAGGGARPLAGMVSFATGLALPFFLLALFPSYLQRMPKSGGWLARVKVVMGFVILAAMLKYISALDQVLQWGFLTRERFLAAWVVLSAMAGLYLLGFVPLEGIKREDRMGLGRLLTAMCFLIFSISLLPGMFGGRLGDLEAYIPPTSGAGAASAGSTQLVWMKNQYREALARAKKEGKLVFVNFTGYACTNCHWMKANMFTRPEIASVLDKFVLVDLYTDGTDEASRINQELEQSKFSTIAIPYYAILDPEERVIASFPGLTRDPKEYLAFLEKGAAGAPAAAPAVAGAAAAELTGLPLTALDGARFNTASLSGKVVVLNFWATWCVPCIQEIPSFNRMNRQLESKGVVFVGVSMDEDGAPLVKSFLKKHPIQYAVALGNEQVAQSFQVNQLPTTVVLDRSGKPQKRFEGFTPAESLEAAVNEVL